MPSTPRSTTSGSAAGVSPVSPQRRGDISRAHEHAPAPPPHTPTPGTASLAWSSPSSGAIPHTPPPPSARFGSSAQHNAHHSPASSSASQHILASSPVAHAPFHPHHHTYPVSPVTGVVLNIPHGPHVTPTPPLRFVGAHAPPLARIPLPPPLPLPPPPLPAPPIPTFDRMMSPLAPTAGFAPTHDPRFRRRGRQPTACTECNRRKQRPCHHCAKRNVDELCRFPEQKSGQLSEYGSDAGQSYTLSHGHGHRHSMSTGAGSGSDDSSTTENPLFKRKSSDDCDLPSPKRPTALFSHQHMGSSSSDRHMITGTHSSPGPLPSPSALSGRVWLLGWLTPDGSTMRRSGPITRPPSIQDLVHHTTPLGTGVQHTTIPVSSERVGAQTPPTPSTRSPSRPPPTFPRSAGGRLRVSRGGSIDDDELMQEGGARGYGSLAVEVGRNDERAHHASSGAPVSPHGHDHFQFYGTSHFGPRAAAQFFQQMSASPGRRVGSRRDTLDVSDTQYALTSPDVHAEAGGNTCTLASHIRALDSRLPPRSLCERYVDVFFRLANSWMDILYEEDFHAKYTTFWTIKGEFEDMTRIDVRWLALFLVVLAFGALLDRNGPNPNGDADTRALSNQLFVGARGALTEAPSFGGESIDTVRAYALLSHYLVMTRRVPEAWNMLGCAVRAAEAQGFHIDGEKWKDLSPKQAELRRRLWAQMYCLDRSISYFLGRPLAIHDDKFSVRPPANMPDRELSVLPRPDWPLATPTKSSFLILHYRLAEIIGHILTTCFGLSPRKHADVMACEGRMVQWMRDLPPVFNFDEPDMAWDDEYPWLRLQRQTLISKFHQARISLHRPYLLHMGYPQSRAACVASAEAELRHRLGLLKADAEALDRFKWMTVASGFAPASILGLLLALNKRHDTGYGYDYPSLRVLFTTYLAAEKRSLRHDPSVDCEMKVLDMMLAKADAREHRRRERAQVNDRDVKPFPTPAPSRHAAAQHTYSSPSYPPVHTQPVLIPPEHLHLQSMPGVGAAISPRRSGVSVSELTLPPGGASASSASGFAPYATGLLDPGPAPAQPPPHVIDGSIMFTPAADEWLIPGRTRPWEQRPPDDPSAAPFPPADDMRGWLGLLDDISLHDLEQCWLGSKPVVFADDGGGGGGGERGGAPAGAEEE